MTFKELMEKLTSREKPDDSAELSAAIAVSSRPDPPTTTTAVSRRAARSALTNGAPLCASTSTITAAVSAFSCSHSSALAGDPAHASVTFCAIP